MIKPKTLKKGDRVATISLSAGTAGDQAIGSRYEIGKKRLEDVFGLEVVPTKHSLRGSEYLYHHPEKRAEDLMEAFLDSSIKMILSNIGGEDTMRILPYIDFEIIRKNPKIFMGYSDTTVNHMMCYQAGLGSFYGPAVLTDFSENVQMSEYTISQIKKTLFKANPVGELQASTEFTAQRLEWMDKNKDIQRTFYPNTPFKSLQGEKKVQGHLIGGCLESLAMLRGTKLFPKLDDFKGAILFLETSEKRLEPHQLAWELRTYAMMGIFDVISGLFFAKPQAGVYQEEYHKEILRILKEAGREDLAVLVNGSFGHNEPKMILPYGIQAEIDPIAHTFKILESGVME